MSFDFFFTARNDWRLPQPNFHFGWMSANKIQESRSQHSKIEMCWLWNNVQVGRNFCYQADRMDAELKARRPFAFHACINFESSPSESLHCCTVDSDDRHSGVGGWTRFGRKGAISQELHVFSAPVWVGLQVHSDWQVAARMAEGSWLTKLRLSLEFPWITNKSENLRDKSVRFPRPVPLAGPSSSERFQG